MIITRSSPNVSSVLQSAPHNNNISAIASAVSISYTSESLSHRDPHGALLCYTYIRLQRRMCPSSTIGGARSRWATSCRCVYIINTPLSSQCVLTRILKACAGRLRSCPSDRRTVCEARTPFYCSNRAVLVASQVCLTADAVD